VCASVVDVCFCKFVPQLSWKPHLDCQTQKGAFVTGTDLHHLSFIVVAVVFVATVVVVDAVVLLGLYSIHLFCFFRSKEEFLGVAWCCLVSVKKY